MLPLHKRHGSSLSGKKVRARVETKSAHNWND
jgi:hypothetical protein